MSEGAKVLGNTCFESLVPVHLISAKSVIERNTITGCEKAGIVIASYANPRVAGNTISEGR